MLQETMKTVEDAENDADNIIKDAKRQAASLVEQAKQKADEILAVANADSKNGMADVSKDRERIEKEFSEKALASAAAEIGSLKKTASEKEAAVVELVISQMI